MKGNGREALVARVKREKEKERERERERRKDCENDVSKQTEAVSVKEFNRVRFSPRPIRSPSPRSVADS